MKFLKIKGKACGEISKKTGGLHSNEVFEGMYRSVADEVYWPVCVDVLVRIQNEHERKLLRVVDNEGS